MHNLIPHFIAERYERKIYSGSFTAAVMVIDLAGFTPLTQSLMENGKEGAEILIEIIEEVFSPSIDTIYDYHGSIASFAGDSFTALFPVDSAHPGHVLSAAHVIQKIFRTTGNLTAKFGDFRLKVRIGLGHGTVNWKILHCSEKAAYYFHGSGIDQAIENEKMCQNGQLVSNRALLSHLTESKSELSFSDVNRVSVLINQFRPVPRTTITPPTLSSKSLSAFLPASILNLTDKGEFRDVAACFVSISGENDVDSSIVRIIETARKFGSELYDIDFGDKGSFVMVIFGSPVSRENVVFRACEFSNTIVSNPKLKVRIGLTFGTVFSGFLGSEKRAHYTVKGNAVNMAARLMTEARWQEILIDEALYQKVKSAYVTTALTPRFIKGFPQKIRVYKLAEKREMPNQRTFQNILVGRSSELSQLQSYLRKTVDSSAAALVYIDGNAGIGKSRLVYELKNSLIKAPINWFTLPCDAILQTSFNPFTTFLKHYFNQSENFSPQINKGHFEMRLEALIESVDDDFITQELTRTSSVLGSLLNLHWENSLFEKLEGRDRFENIKTALVHFFLAENQLKPTVIEVEDAHWIDPATESVLKSMSPVVRDRPLLLLIVSRLGDNDAPLRLSFSLPHQYAMQLNSLSSHDFRALIRNQLHVNLSPEIDQLIFRKSEGNPFYGEQILLYLMESGALVQGEGTYSLQNNDFDIPDQISTIIISRIDRLPEKCKDIIKIASVIGQEFSVKLLSEVLHNRDIKPELDILEKESIWISLSDLRYSFKHALIRDTVYQMQLKKKLRTIHKLVARTIEELHRKELRSHYHELAYHYDKAEVVGKACLYLEKAADYASSNYKNQEALTLYDRLLNYEHKPKKRIEINYSKAAVLKLISRWDDALQLYEENVSLAKALDDQDTIALNISHIGVLQLNKGNLDLALKLFHQSPNVVENVKKPRIKGKIYFNWGNVHFSRGDQNTALKYFLIAQKISQAEQDLETLGSAASNIGMIYNYQSDYEQALEQFFFGLEIAEKRNNEKSKSSLLNNIGLVYSSINNFDKAEIFFQKALDIASKLGNIRHQAFIYGNLGSLYEKGEDLCRALEYCQKDLEISLRIDDKIRICTATGNIGFIHDALGNYSVAEKVHKRVFKMAHEIGHKRMMNMAYSNLGSHYLLVRNLDAAEKYLDKAILLCREMKDKYHLTENLHQKAELLFLREAYPQAKAVSREAMAKAHEINLTDIKFLSQLLQAKIRFQTDQSTATRELEKMLPVFDRDQEKAAIYYELFQITKNEKWQSDARQLYEKLFRKTPRIEYKNRIAQLTTTKSSGIRSVE